VRSSAGAAQTPASSAPGAPPAAPDVSSPETLAPALPQARAPETGSTQSRPAGMLTGGAEQFANRLHKNIRRLSRQLHRENITCYRLYDADLPDYNLVIDVYGDWVHVQEYAPPAEIDPGKVRRRLEDGLAVIGSVLDVPPERVVLKERRRQRGAAQYERRASDGGFLPVEEDDLTYLVNLHDYLDTGLFLDQRLTRRLVRKLAGGRRFLNLFAYTGTMTVDALAGGSPATTTIDLSSTYLEWARRNLEANGFSAELESSGAAAQGRVSPPASANRLVQADCLRWVAEADGAYDLIWLDPPTFSNSKKMGRATFDVQRDHADLIRITARRFLAPGGILLFATNRRGFKLEHGELGGLSVKDISRATLPFDCSRGANRHHVFSIKRP
jgi:23S rRNA (guanine2445-N2)-methyltransferase / 23S rRNA (guanine2069-N7)-methyltransferase